MPRHTLQVVSHQKVFPIDSSSRISGSAAEQPPLRCCAHRAIAGQRQSSPLVNHLMTDRESGMFRKSGVTQKKDIAECG
jgi:hypothetical protein